MNLADLENAVVDEPEQAEEAEPEQAEEAESGQDGQEPVLEEEAGPAELEDEAQLKIGDEVLTGKELKAERLRQADYTRKTQQLAEDKRAFEQERDGLLEENEELKHWVSSLRDPHEMRFELERYFPETYEALRDLIIQEAIEEQDMSPREKELARRTRQAEAAEKARQKDEQVEMRKAERREQEQRTAELRHTFNGWLQETMTAAGLDPRNPRHQKLVRREIQTEHKGKTWTKDTFVEACKEIAAGLGVQAKGKAALPPISAKGNKPKTPTEPKSKAKTHTEDFFANLRKG